MYSRKSTRLLLLALLLALALAACRRGAPEAVPTLVPTATTEEIEPVDTTAAPTAEAEPEATAEPIVAQPVPVEDIDWPPQVIASDPLPGQEVAVNTPITLRFDQPMDQASVAAAFSVEPAVEGELTWPEANTAVFTPVDSLDVGQVYNVRVAETASSVNGQSLPEPVEFAIQAAGPLRVAQVIPGHNAGEVQTDAIITVVFDKPVVPLLSSGEQAGLPQPLTFDPPVEGRGEWTTTSIYRFFPEPALAGGTTYTVSVDPALTDLSGNPIEAAPTWEFTTLRPDVVLVDPENEKSRVAPDASILVIFNMPMDMASVEASTSLAGEGGAPIPITFKWRDNRAVDITPVDLLPLGVEYTLTVAASAASENGAATMEGDHVSAFDVVPLPAVINTFPADGGTADIFQNGASIEFASPMNDETVQDQIVVTPDPGEIDYFINEWEEGYSVYLEFDLEPDTQYTVTVPGTAADPFGNTLGEDYTFTFNAPPPAPLASFNLPREVAQVSTSFPSDVQLLYRNVSAMDVSLYEAGDNMALLFDTYRLAERVPSGEPIFQTTVTPDVAAGELGVATVSLAGGGALPTGVYELRVTAPELTDDTVWWQNRNVLLIVADTNLVVKEMFGEVNVWATDLATGEPVSGLDLTLFRRTNGAEAGTAVTDASGFARFDYEPSETYLDGVAVVSNAPGEAGFGLASTNWNGGVMPWQLGLTWDTGPEPAIYAYIYTDRPIFRPGDTVYFKGIVRDTNFGRYALPDLQELELSVNPNFFFGEDIFSETFTVILDEEGVFHGEFALPDDMPLGTYSFNITGDYWLSSRSFTVAEYRAPEFVVTVTPEQKEALRGEAVNVNVNATYLFGGSAAGLPVGWSISATSFTPVFDTSLPYVFGDAADFDYVVSNPFIFGPEFGQSIGEGSAETDAAGNVTITVPADSLDETEAGSREVTVETNVGGLGEFPVSGRATIIFHAAEVYVGLYTRDTVVDAGGEATVDLLTVDWAGEPIGNQSVEVVFYERDWESERVDSFGTRVTQWTPVDTEIGRESVTTDESGEATVTFTPETGGSFIAVATVTDAGGREQFSSLNLWSVDEDFAGWRTDPNMRTMELTPDKAEYRAGETARILVQSPFAQPVNAWLTIERGNIIDQQVVTVNGSQVLEIPITAEFAPNVHVTVTAVKPVNPDDPDFPYADIRVGFAELVVPPDQFDLTVTLTPGAVEYAPGDTATFDVAVTDQAGNPVQAEVSLALVDLAVLLLKEDNAPPILEAFYAPQPLRSNIGSGLLITGEGLAIEEPVGIGGGGGGGGGDEGLDSLRLQSEDDARRDFKDTAFWEAKLFTDANGRASVEVPLPDNVTTWRMHSKAATVDTEVGQASVDILARLPLIVRPVTPRFFTVGDNLRLSANVNNNTNADIEATVSLEATGVVIDGDAEQTVTVPANGRALVSWNVTVEDVAAADLTFRAEGGGFRDASKPTVGIGEDALLPIYRFDGRDFVATAGELDEAGRRVEALVLPEGVDTRHGEVLVKLQPSLAAAIIESFDVINDPIVPFIECSASLADRLLHNTAVEKAIRELGVDQAGLATSLATQNTNDAAKLAGLQMADGGWGWCFSDDSDPWVSAQALLALVRASELGYEVDAAVSENLEAYPAPESESPAPTRVDGSVIEKGAAYVQAQLEPINRLGDAGDANRQAFFLYVMAEAGADVTADADELVDEHRALLDPYAKALLALAYESGANQAALLTDLNDEVIMSATGAHWEDDEQDFMNLSSDIRGTAMVIEALAQLQPDSPLLPPAVRWLMVARQAETWSTLHATAWSVSALSEWMVASGELEADYAYELLVNLQSRASGAFTADDATASEVVQIPLNELLADDTNFFDFQRGDGDGRLYYTLRLNSAIAVDQLDPVSRGFTVERRYFDAACDTAEEECEPIDSIPANGRVRVELTVIVPNDRVYVMVEDPIPAGTDAIDPNLLTSESNRGGVIVPSEGEFGRGFWGWWYWDHIQYRDEKVVFLSQFLPAGTYQYTYFLQANVPGVYQVMPATAREQYFPEVFGRSEGAIFTIIE